MAEVRLLFLGDIVGSSGRKVIQTHLPSIKKEETIDFVIANAENSAHGFGITPSIAQELFEAGVDCLTGGNHTFDKKEVYQTFQNYPDRVLRPANYPVGTGGRGSTVLLSRSGHRIGVLNLMGRVFMEPIDCPFQVFEREIEGLRQETPLIFLDMHAEATSEKQAMGRFVDGKVSAVVGTHTHTPTADARILPLGTGYLTDCGMNGCYDSVIGMKTEIILQRFRKKQHVRMEVSEGPGSLWGVIYTVDASTGRCLRVKQINRDWKSVE
jgi:metallophosphoesterase (TIGR00282 family)